MKARKLAVALLLPGLVLAPMAVGLSVAAAQDKTAPTQDNRPRTEGRRGQPVAVDQLPAPVKPVFA